VVVSGFLTGGFRVALFQVALCILNIAVWSVFVKKMDQIEFEKEQLQAE